MRVIRKGNPKEVECKHCGSLIEYEPQDVKSEKVHMNEFEKYVVCPICNSRVRVSN